jgi:hypothetical protein
MLKTQLGSYYKNTDHESKIPNKDVQDAIT